MEEVNVFELFSPPLVSALKERGFLQPTDPQMKLVPIVLQGKNALLLAPTGTGKTEAAFLPILDMMIRDGASHIKGIKLLYITPLRALNRDMLERMQWWCKRFDIRLGVRHSDSTQAERTNLSLVPPDILITTPETLQILLVGKRLRQGLSSLRWVIIDEAHELAEDKRGSQLAVGLERLREIVGRDFQVIGLSATVGSPERIAKLLVGIDRDCEIVKVPVEKGLELSVIYPEPIDKDRELAEVIFSFPEVASRLRLIHEIVNRYKSVLIFTNTRTEAEVLANRFRVWNPEFPIGIHHSSLSRVTREAVERGLKDGKLWGVICTSSLELGIDIGFLEYVIQYNSPRQVSRLIQRIGRSGHRVGEVSRGLIITQDSDDTLEAMVLCRRALIGELEPLEPFEVPYDVAIHQISGLLIEKGKLTIDQVYSFLKKTYPFKGLEHDKLLSILAYMRDRYPRLAYFNEADGVLARARDVKPLFDYYFENLSMIPDEKQYIVLTDDDRPVGVLDEAFVSEYGEIGVKFVEAGRCWKIQEIYGDKVYVKPEEDPTGAVPNWVGDEIPVPFDVAIEVGRIRGRYAEAIRDNKGEEFIDELSKSYPASKAVIRKALKEVEEQYHIGLPIPSDRLVTIEKWDRYIIVQAHFGHKVNRLLARVIGYIISERVGQSVAVHQDPYRIVIEADVSAESVHSILKGLPNTDLRAIAEKAIERSGIFKRRLIHAGKKCGTIAKDADYASVSISGLIEALRETPVYDEAMKVIFHDDVDLDGARRILERIRQGEISIELIDHDELSPIARIGIEEISRRGEIVSPERLRALLRESTRARVLETFLVIVCTSCWEYIELKKVREMEGVERCPRCNKKSLGITSESYERTFLLSLKARSGASMHGIKLRFINQLKRSAELRTEHGHIVDILIAGRGIRLNDIPQLIERYRRGGVDIIELLIEGEREALRRRYFATS